MIKEQQFQVSQAPQVAVSGEAFDDSGVRVAQALSSLVSDLGKFGEQLSGMYAQKEQSKLRQAEKGAEDRAYTDIATAMQQDPEYLTKFDQAPEGWTPQKWTAYNDLKARTDVADFGVQLADLREAYTTAVSNDPNRIFDQRELDSLYQNALDRKLHQSNGSGTYLRTFLPGATSAINSAAKTDRSSRATERQNKFTEKADQSITAAIAGFDPETITVEEAKRATTILGDNANSENVGRYVQAERIYNTYLLNRQAKKDLGLATDNGQSMVEAFKRLSLNGDVDLMEYIMDMEIPGTNIPFKQSGVAVELDEVYQQAVQDAEAGKLTEITSRVGTVLKTIGPETNELLNELTGEGVVQPKSLVNFHNTLRGYNQQLNELATEINLLNPENRTGLLAAINKRIDSNNNLINRGNGVYFADSSNSSAVSRIYRARMLGTMTDEMLFDERANLKYEDYENFLFMQDEVQEAHEEVIRGFINFLGVDPKGATLEQMMSARFFKPGSAEAIALNEFAETLYIGGPKATLMYYDKFGKEPLTMQQRMYNNDVSKALYDRVQASRDKATETTKTQVESYRNNPDRFFEVIVGQSDQEAVFQQLTPDEQEAFIKVVQGYNVPFANRLRILMDQ